MKIAIFYFSGTGNTEYVSNLLKDYLTTNGHVVDVHNIEDVSEPIDVQILENIDFFGLGFPVHAFNAPKNVFTFIKKMIPQVSGTKAFAFRTAGDPAMKSGSTSMVRKALKRKGFDVWYERRFIMPSNVFVKYEDEVTKQLYLLAEQMAEEMAAELVQSRRLQKNGLLLRIGTFLFSKMETFGMRRMAKWAYKVDDACNLCLYCVKNCPTQTVYVREKKDTKSIKFAKSCVGCMRCIYNCPENAINLKFMKFFQLEDGYSQEENLAALNDPEIEANALKDDTKGFYKRFVKFFKQELGEDIFTGHTG